ncbi:MAG TPA: N-acetyltransferase [Anaerolineae bacterium]|nr:N-acetyltransferase [Anaerolineae bacterium]HQK12868.1 N-acetyltransferase [Anaerolineae bacterium]
MSGKLVIQPAETAAERKAFIHFMWKVYKGDPYWVPPLISERVAFLDPQKHPFHQHAKVRYFTAQRDGQIVGTIAGIINYNHNQYWGDKVGFFGLFEVLPDEEAARALLATAEDYVRSEGMDTLRGPVNFSTNEECGLLVDGWNGPPVAMLTYNPPYYAEFIERAGFVKAHDLYAYLTDISHVQPDGTGFNPKVLRVAEKVRQRLDGITIRPINMRDFEHDARLFKEVYNQAWSKNWGFVPLTDAELAHEVMALKPIIDPPTVLFVEKDGQAIGASLPLPDVNQALIRAYPRPGVPDWWSLAKMMYWWKVRKCVTTLRAFAGGLLEAHRGSGLIAVLALEDLKVALRRGYTHAEFSWVLESNIPMRQTAANFMGKHYRTYRIYDKAVDSRQ